MDFPTELSLNQNMIDEIFSNMDNFNDHDEKVLAMKNILPANAAIFSDVRYWQETFANYAGFNSFKELESYLDEYIQKILSNDDFHFLFKRETTNLLIKDGLLTDQDKIVLSKISSFFRKVAEQFSSSDIDLNIAEYYVQIMEYLSSKLFLLNSRDFYYTKALANFRFLFNEIVTKTTEFTKQDKLRIRYAIARSSFNKYIFGQEILEVLKTVRNEQNAKWLLEQIDSYLNTVLVWKLPLEDPILIPRYLELKKSLVYGILWLHYLSKTPLTPEKLKKMRLTFEHIEKCVDVIVKFEKNDFFTLFHSLNTLGMKYELLKQLSKRKYAYARTKIFLAWRLFDYFPKDLIFYSMMLNLKKGPGGIFAFIKRRKLFNDVVIKVPSFENGNHFIYFGKFEDREKNDIIKLLNDIPPYTKMVIPASKVGGYASDVQNFLRKGRFRDLEYFMENLARDNLRIHYRVIYRVGDRKYVKVLSTVKFSKSFDDLENLAKVEAREFDPKLIEQMEYSNRKLLASDLKNIIVEEKVYKDWEGNIVNRGSLHEILDRFYRIDKSRRKYNDRRIAKKVQNLPSLSTSEDEDISQAEYESSEKSRNSDSNSGSGRQRKSNWMMRESSSESEDEEQSRSENSLESKHSEDDITVIYIAVGKLEDEIMKDKKDCIALLNKLTNNYKDIENVYNSIEEKVLKWLDVLLDIDISSPTLSTFLWMVACLPYMNHNGSLYQRLLEFAYTRDYQNSLIPFLLRKPSYNGEITVEILEYTSK